MTAVSMFHAVNPQARHETQISALLPALESQPLRLRQIAMILLDSKVVLFPHYSLGSSMENKERHILISLRRTDGSSALASSYLISQH